MRIRRAEVIPFSVPLPASVENSQRTWTSRSGILLRLVDDSGRVGLGEASPLPDYSPDTPEACGSALSDLRWADDYDLDPGALVPAQLAAWSRGIGARLPAARFAMETALLDLAGQRAQKPVWALLSAAEGPSAEPVRLSTVLTRLDEVETVRTAENASERGIDTIKVKVGRRAERDRELSLLETLRRALPNAAIRLDANRALSEDTLVRDLAAFSFCSPELIEEPAPLRAVRKLEDSPIRIALDESLQDASDFEGVRDVAAQPWCAAAVLKPTALGGFSRCLELARWAIDTGLNVLVSHTFEGVVAHAAAAHLALAVASRRYASGLDVHPGLDTWPRMPSDLLAANAVLPTARAGLGLDAARILEAKP